MATNGVVVNGNGQAALDLQKDSDQSRVAVHSFDPDAAPEAEGAAAGKAHEDLNLQKAPPEQEVPVDRGNSAVVPTIAVHDADVASEKPQLCVESVKEVDEDTAVLPGALPAAAAPSIPDWYRVGWRQVSGIDQQPPREGEEKDKAVLETFFTDQYYGSWYHNAGVIVFAVFVSHFLTRFHFGWGWLFIILAVCNTYYTTSMHRVRRRARDDIQRELVKTRLASESESADWINNFLDRFWLIYEPVLSATIVSSVDQVLSSSTPAFLDSMRLSTFTLGTKAPRIDHVRTFPKTPDDIVMMDWGVSFTPNEISEMTAKQVASKVNPKIVLSVRVGKGLATAVMPILLEDISFKGNIRIRMKLMTNFPHVQIVDICFLEKPVIDYVLKPIGGETLGFDIANIPGLSSFIREMTHSTLGPMMYDPNVFTLNLEQLLSGAPSDSAIGVLQVTVHSARGIKGSKIGGGTPDPFVAFTINNRAELARTKCKHNTYNPTWMETNFILVNNLTESLVFNLYDYNDHRKNTLLGSSIFELTRLQEDATQEGMETQLLMDGKERGELRYDVSFFPVLHLEDDNDARNTSIGIVRLTVHQAKELDAKKSLSGDLNPLAKVFLSGSKTPVHVTKAFKHTNNPVWESSHEFLCAKKATSVITVKIVDDRDFLKDPVVGYMSINLEDLLASKKENIDWFPLSNCESGKLRISAEWKPLSMAGSLHGVDQYSPPIGVVRLLLDRATDVKNVEATLGGKSDPYTRVQVNNVTMGRTEVVNNNLNPVWDQIIYITVHSLKETLLLECMDYQHLTRDRSLGSVELRVSELAEESDDKMYPFQSTGVKTATDPLRLDGANVFKGDLHYTASFIPAMKLKGIKFDSHSKKIHQAAAGDNDSESDLVTDGAASISSTDEEAQAMPDGVTIKGTLKKHTRATKSTDTTATTSETQSPVEEGIEMSMDDLMTHQSGIIIFNVISGQLTKKARVEVLLDDGYWPCFSTTRARSTKVQWDYVGEGFLKELDFGQVWLRLNEADEGDKDDIIAQWKGDAKSFLQSTLAGPQTFTLRDESERDTSRVTVEAHYVPVPVKLEPRESINNQGVLRVDLIDGREIPAADRSGKSDPYAVFTLNEHRVFKSQTKKKTLSPEWNENFVVSVPSRVAADFEVEIFDWNQLEQAKSLGSAKINLADLEPFEASELELSLSSPKLGPKGRVHVRLMFQPEIIAKSRKNTSTFSTAGRAMTQVGVLPLSAGKGVIHGVTGLFKSKDADEVPAIPELPAGQASVPIVPDIISTLGSHILPDSKSKTSLDGTHEPGTLRVTVLDAKDLSSTDSKAYATIRLGDKEFKTKHAGKTATPEWDETFVFAAGPYLSKIRVWIHDHKTLGKDKLLGEGDIDIWRHIKAEEASAAEMFLELREGQGLLRLRLEYDPTQNPPGRSSMGSRENVTHRTVSIASPSRFSIRGRRPGGENDD
ncbi:tricalbin [Guyanagaster necrorhizus]|uniref:Tricalbin n=1 Tax=Guyanagaster necrorhizus TaxID=856835 RepID=A0A9P7W192_9AGAR|nr:tricalbin [Guyanagaster necrorhizus MCA 3950]KAG7450195.1 tricalbin [Guyanagaster necrorhizus MCA 3950]